MNLRASARPIGKDHRGRVGSHLCSGGLVALFFFPGVGVGDGEVVEGEGACCLRRGDQAVDGSSELSVGGGVWASCDEEHSELVVGGVGVASGGACAPATNQQSRGGAEPHRGPRAASWGGAWPPAPPSRRPGSCTRHQDPGGGRSHGTPPRGYAQSSGRYAPGTSQPPTPP